MEQFTILFAVSLMIYIFVTSCINIKLRAFDTNALPNTIIVMMEMIQQQSNYKIMQHDNPLSTGELIALIVYTYSRSYCQKMKQYRNTWYCTATNAVNKLYSVLHYRNDQPQPKMLFHGTNNPSFDQFSQHKLCFTEFCSFSAKFTVAEKFATGSVLVITEVDKRLRSGQLKAADVSWISPFDEYEWILLPTTFHNWREMSKQDIIDYGWQIGEGIKVYISDEYESNVHVDYNMDRSTKYWFDNERYFDLFIEIGVAIFELIKDISYVLLKLIMLIGIIKIGIIKIAHINCILRTIKVLDEYLKNKQHQLNVDDLSEIMKDINQYKDVHLCDRKRNNRVICKCEWIHHDTIPINQFGPIFNIGPEERQHIAKSHPDLHLRLIIHKQQ